MITNNAFFYIRAKCNAKKGGRNVKEHIGAWIYCRIGASENSNDSLKEQRKELSDYAESMGFSIAGVSEDVGSGLDMNRPGILNLLKAVEESRVEILLVKSLDRLGRNYSNTIDFRLKLEHMNVKIYSPQQGEISLEKKWSDALRGKAR